MSDTKPSIPMQHVAASPAAFREHLLVDCDAGARPLGSIIDDWQRADFRALDDSWRAIVGQDVQPRYMRSLWERPRGHSKTSDLAVQVCYGLFASRQKIDGVCVAADRDQAALLRDAIERKIRLNPWLPLQCQRDRVLNTHTGSQLTVLPADVASSWGLLCDFIVMDEVSAWPARDMFDSLLSTAAKKKNCLLLAITNAGSLESWFWPLREAIVADPAWYHSRLDGPVASWIAPEHLDEQRRLLLPQQYMRLWENKWVTGEGDSLPWADIEACTTLPGRQSYRADRLHVAGADFSLRRDHSAFVVCAVDPLRGIVEVPFVYSWKPADFGGQIELTSVQRDIIAICGTYHVALVVYDEWQAAQLCEGLNREGIATSPMTFSTANRDAMAASLMNGLRERQFAFYPDADLLSDLKKMRVKEAPHLGLRLEAPRDAAGGHCDRGFALASVAPLALSLAQSGIDTESRNEVDILVPV